MPRAGFDPASPTRKASILSILKFSLTGLYVSYSILPGLVLAGEIWLINSNIPEYLQANRFNHAPKRPRKLLLHRRQINKLVGAVEREGMTLVPLKLYFNEKGRAKIELALARGKKLYDKREVQKKRSWERERGRLLRQKG